MISVAELCHEAGVAFQEKKFRDAEAYLERALAMNPSDGIALYMMGTLKAHVGCDGQAIPYLGLAASVLKNNSADLRLGCLINLSTCLRRNGHYDQSKEAAEQALEVDEESGDGWNNMAAIIL